MSRARKASGKLAPDAGASRMAALAIAVFSLAMIAAIVLQVAGVLH